MKKNNILISLLIVAIFSLRWQNCLPFSGKMPVIDNSDVVSIWGRNLIFIKENFSFPLGVIKGLSFPFKAANIARAFPLFTLPLKLLSKIFPTVGQFYYFPLAEIIGVFLTAYFTLLILDKFKVKFWPLKLLGAALTALSPALLFRSSPYYGISIIFWYFPLFLIFSYFYIVFYQQPTKKLSLILSLIFASAILVDSYIFMGIAIIFIIFLVLNTLDFLINKNEINGKRVFGGLIALIIGLLLFLIISFLLGNQENLKVPVETSLFATRNKTNWGYGGGFGGGFHVADVLSLIIAPDGRWGPPAYLAQFGFPLTTSNLQEGQYEGFAYLGTVAIELFLFLILIKILKLIKNFRLQLIKLKLALKAKLFIKDQLFSLPAILAIAAFSIYILSWGYIIHIGGVRLNNVPTLSLIISMLWRQFMFARGLGRFAIPLTIFITMGMVIYLGERVQLYTHETSKGKRILVAFIIILLSAVHVYEIKGYLQPPAEVVYGNEVFNIFSEEDKILIKKLTQGKKALMVVPEPRGRLNWAKICYALAFYSDIPISGATIGPPGELDKHLRQYESDVEDIMSGRMKKIVSRYGEIAVATFSDDAQIIIEQTNIPLKSYNLNDQDVTILTLDK